MTETPGLTEGTLLGGRVRYTQPAQGYRTGLEPVLLAASVPARPGERVLEAGTGAGAGLLCLSSRIPSVICVGVERDPAMAALATANAAANECAALRIACAAIEDWAGDGIFHHAFANPPWHDAAGTPSPLPARRGAKLAAPGLLGDWAAALARAVRPRGTVSLIVPAARWGEAAGALAAAHCAEMTLLPLWPHAGEAARLIIVRGVRLGRGACSVAPGLVLHQAGGTFTPHAAAILRDGAAL